MDYGALETELVGVLKAFFGANTLSTLDARVMPETAAEILQTYEKALANVHYMDSDYDKPASTSTIVQNEHVHVSIYLQADNMKDPDSGGYTLLTATKDALTGYMPANARTRMWISGYGDWQVEDGQMMPYVEFTFDTLHQQKRNDSEEEIGGTLSSIGGDLEIPE